MSATTSPIERFVRQAILVPVGVALAVCGRLPELVAEGQAEIDRQVRAARMIGTFAVAQAKREVEMRVSPPTPAPKTPIVSPPDHLTVPFEGYDSLSAAEVVKRLAGLSASERSRVSAYEGANRGRRTILGRIEQLD